MIRLGLADDHLLVRKSLAHLVSTFDSVEVVLEAENGQHLLKLMPEVQLDIVLLDIQMPHMDGYEACNAIRELYPDVKVLMVSHLETEQNIQKVMACGAHGFFSKNSNPDQLEIAINSVWNKEYYFDMEISAVLRKAMFYKADAPKISQPEHIITDREIDVLRLAGREFNSIEIADKLNINVRTVETHRKHIMEKTKSKNFIGAIVFALQYKLISFEELEKTTL